MSSKAINLEALHYYLSYRHVPTPLSAIDGVRREPLLTFPNLRFSPPHELSEDEIVDRMDEMVQGYVKKVLDEQGDNVGFFLSGGLDSGIVTAVAATLTDSFRPLRTFCLTYGGNDETAGKKTDREYARWIAELYGTRHRERAIYFEDFPAVLPNILRYIGEPFSGYVSVWFLSRFVKSWGIDVAFSGDWADELFGSYKVHRLAYQTPHQHPWELRYSDSVFGDREKQSLYSKDVRQVMKKYSTMHHLEKYFTNGLTADDSLNRMLEMELKYIFPDNVYMSVLKMSQYHGLEIRTPYSSPEFVEFAAKIPGSLKMKDGVTKYPLKQLALRYLPEEIVNRKKEGFVTPTMPLVLELEKFVRDTLALARLGEHGLLDIDYVWQLIEEFYNAPTEQQAYKLWSLVCFQVWYDL